MSALISCLFASSSPTTRRIFHRASLLPRAPSWDPIIAGGMLSRAASQGTGQASSPRSGLYRQPFPSQSQNTLNGDIRKQFKTSTANNSAAAASCASARTMPDTRGLLPKPPSKPTPAMASANLNGRLHSICGNSSSSFTRDTPVIDLTGPDPSTIKSKIHETVYFVEDDLSDDDHLDLDYQAPIPLPTAPTSNAPAHSSRPPASSVVRTATRTNLGSSQSEAPIPWSSSPASHFAPPALRPTPALDSATTHRSLKRQSSGDSNPAEIPIPKSKRRVLPASFRQPASDSEQDVPLTTATKKKALWDAPASHVEMQKKQLKNQQSSRQPQAETSKDGPQQTSGSISKKKVAISLSTEQQQVLDLVVNKGESVFFTGPAGTGKSVLMRAIVDELKKKYKKDPERVAVTASTGLAACNIGGITLHSFSGIGLGKEEALALVKKIKRNPKARNRWIKTKCLIIDEISMVDGDLFDKLSYIGRVIRNNGRPWGGIQLVITGDFFQLPPVPDHEKSRESKFAFDASTWSTSIDHTIGLSQVFRQRDPEFARMLNEMRLGKIRPDTVRAFKALDRPLDFKDGVDSAELFPTRIQVTGSNEKRLRDLPGEIRRYDAVDTGDPAIRDKLLQHMMAPKSLDLKVNAQVMLIKNLDETLVNGSLGRVISFSDEKTFEMDDGSYGAGYGSDPDDRMSKARRKLQGFSNDVDSPVPSGRRFPVVQFISTSGTPRTIMCVPEEWRVELPNGEVQAKRSQLPLILAWCLSIHKAQGQTLERVTVNLGRVFEKGQAYVALSRATTQQGLRVINFDPAKVMAHPKVVEFYGKLYSAGQAIGSRPVTIANFVGNKGGVQPPARMVPQLPNMAQKAEVINLDDDEEAMESYAF
ncbi:hypothetical protein CDD82_4898 [Ophiocordyceps australis]|uniref:ATP-dependent DNA helicase PIF1 n=1 Tax=Ophiocordyceps australis TaxID=1399860 RepID=A0A2C5Z3Z6_9HYPO|nr:hypothetical protein CDD82_4898 [Ophiocordyceps australis]